MIERAFGVQLEDKGKSWTLRFVHLSAWKNLPRDFSSLSFLSWKKKGGFRLRTITRDYGRLFEAKLHFEFYSPVLSLLCPYVKAHTFEYAFPSFDVYSFYRKLLAARRCNNPFATGSRNFSSYMHTHTHIHTHIISFAYNEAVHYTGGKELHIFRQTSFLVNLASRRRRRRKGGRANLMDELAREYFHGKRRLRVRVGWLNANHDLRHRAWKSVARKKRDFSSPLFIYYAKSNFAAW